MKKLLPLFIALFLLLSGCAGAGGESEADSGASAEDGATSSALSGLFEPVIPHEFTGTATINNLNYTNPGHMGDNDGPAFCVYSKRGYNKAEMKFELSKVEHSMLGTKGARVNGFAFLGIDVYNDDGYWINCCDAGVYYADGNGGWTLFSNTYDSDGSGSGNWYNSSQTLDPKRDYLITLDSSGRDGMVTVTARYLDSGHIAAQHIFTLFGSKADGGNTSYLTNFAVDWTRDTWVDINGDPTDDWVRVMEACRGQGMYFKNIRIYDCALYKGGKSFDWTPDLTDRRCLCPDAVLGATNDEVITVRSADFDTEYIIDIDLH